MVGDDGVKGSLREASSGLLNVALEIARTYKQCQ